MIHRFRRVASSLVLALIVAGCGGAPPFPAYNTYEDALGQVLHQQTTIGYHEPFDENRTLVLFRTDQNPGLSPTLLERTPFGKWRMTDAVGLNDGLYRLGALSYGRGGLGHHEEKFGTATTVTAEAHLLYGEVLDPEITWVEVTLAQPDARPLRATVLDGVWLLKIPANEQSTWFDLRAGNADGVRFAADVGKTFSQHRSLVPETAPLVEYLDKQQGIWLQHPAVGPMPRVDQRGRLILGLGAWTITVERKAREPGSDLSELLRVAVAGAAGPVLEQGVRPLGDRQAAYLLETSPAADGRGSTYSARYLVLTEHFRYDVSCSVAHISTPSLWRSDLEPVCRRVLDTVRLDI